MTVLRNPQHGEIIKEQFLKEIDMSQNQQGYALSVPSNQIHAIVNGTGHVMAEQSPLPHSHPFQSTIPVPLQ
jgi:plasmid maintenance system antidote protein VapI